MKKSLLLASALLLQGGFALTQAQSDLSSQQLTQQLLPGTTDAYSFGWGVAVGGDHLFISQYGAPSPSGETKVGRVLVYDKTDAGWAVSDTIQSPINLAGTAFGYSLATDGKRLIVGATESFSSNTYLKSYGFVCIYSQDASGKWTQENSSPLRQDAGNQSGMFGSYVAIDGDVAVAGAPSAKVGSLSGVGSASIITRGADGTWTVNDLTSPSSTTANNFGRAVAVSGDTVIVATAKGADWYYTKQDGKWTNSIILPVVMNSSSNQASVALDGSTLMIANIDNKKVQVYGRTDTGWTDVQEITSDLANFGQIVMLKGNRAVVTVRNGNAFVYEKANGTWTAKSVIDYVGSGAAGTIGNFGYSASFDGTTVAVAAPIFAVQNEAGTWVSTVGSVFTYNLGAVANGVTPVASADNALVYGVKGGIAVNAAEATQLVAYRIDGRLAAQQAITAGETTVSLPAGIYIVRLGASTVKVVVK
jgi:hypothetical protein